MITVVYLIFFTLTQETQMLAGQEKFKTIEECNLYAERQKLDQQQKVLEGISMPHTARHVCIVWGEDI